jgi:hypothetical protein
MKKSNGNSILPRRRIIEGAEAAWVRVTKEIVMFKDIIDKSGMKNL